jgi:periplasmic divalent cation tolerance protein
MKGKSKTKINRGIKTYPDVKTDNTIITLLCNVPTPVCANNIAQALIETHLAACVNVFPEVTSFYRWQGKIEKAVEIPLLIKTTAACLADIKHLFCTLHPYEVPELLVYPVAEGLSTYLQWIVANVHPIYKEP